MKQALQAILIAPDPSVRLAIMMGKKKITIREGHRDYKAGPVMICCHIEPWTVLSMITQVRHTTLAELTIEELQADGYPLGHQQAMYDLKKYYPDISMESPVTVIEWGDIDNNCYYAKATNIMDYARAFGLEGLLRNLTKQ